MYLIYTTMKIQIQCDKNRLQICNNKNSPARLPSLSYKTVNIFDTAQQK